MLTHFKRKKIGSYLVTFSLFWAPKTLFRIYENKEKSLFYFGLTNPNLVVGN
jgi:hypothetical protein